MAQEDNTHLTEAEIQAQLLKEAEEMESQHQMLEPGINNAEEFAKELAERANTSASVKKKIPAPWRLSAKTKEHVSNAVGMFNTKYGLFAAIPMLCKGEECPFATLYPHLHEASMEEGERCPVEVAFIMTKYEQYIKELQISEHDAVDMSMLRDLIDYDIQILRADNQIAVEGRFSMETVVSVTENGVPIYREEISVAANYKDKIQVKRNRTLELLNSTRKDKAGDKLTVAIDPSSYTRKLMEKLDDVSVIDAQFEELEMAPDVPYIQQLKKSKLTNQAKLEAKQDNPLAFLDEV